MVSDQDKRDELFERAALGEITGEEADAEAERLGLGKLSHQPPDFEFDPFKEAQWSLTMAVAWIAFRDSKEVRGNWDKYRQEYTYWNWSIWRRGIDGPVHEGWHLKVLKPSTMTLLALTNSYANDRGLDPKFSMSVTEAQEALWIALQTDCFRATGVNQETGVREEILPLTWQELKCFEHSGRDELRPTPLNLTGPNRYRDALFPSAALRGLWREPFKHEPLKLPETVRPDGDGYMPLYLAAQWIATEGGKALSSTRRTFHSGAGPFATF